MTTPLDMVAPPALTRFKAGQSGNPKGRPKGRRKMGELLDAVLAEQITIREGDRFRKVSRAEAAVRALIQKAMRGDAKSCSMLLKLTQQSGEFEKNRLPYNLIRRIIVNPKDGSEVEY
jgi:hypothetical protein